MDSTLASFEDLSQAASWQIRRSVLKRSFDMLFSLSMLVLLSPLFLGITLIIRFSCKGKAIYAQPRLGRGGKIFKCYKFRTMYLDAEERLQDLILTNPRLKQEWEKKQKLKNDPRIFPGAKWLRNTSLDELPQLWNVVKGDLSIVGPRPYLVSQEAELGPLIPKILSVRPGLTGLWQTSGRSRTTFRKRILLDAQYVDKSSFAYDLYLIIKTIPQILLAKDAY